MKNEKRLIDANKRIEEIKKANCTNCDNYNGIKCRACWVDDAIGLIDDAPTVDAVVLPCKLGDTVYRKDGAWDVVGFDCNRGGGWKVKLERWKDQFRDYHESTRVSSASFGKTVFLIRAEAESALCKDGRRE